MLIRTAILLNIVFIIPSLSAADISIPQEIDRVVKQILFENYQLLPHINNKEAYALLLTSKGCNNAVTSYRKNQVNDFNDNYAAYKKNVLVFKGKMHGQNVIAYVGVIFDASGNYASGFIKQYDYAHFSDQSTKVRKFLNGDHHYGRCIFKYPSLEYVTTIICKIKQECLTATATPDRKLSLSIIKDKEEILHTIASVWMHSAKVIRGIHKDAEYEVDGPSITYTNHRHTQHAHTRTFFYNGNAIDSKGNPHTWWHSKKIT